MNRAEAKELVRNVEYDDLTIEQFEELAENEIFRANYYYTDMKLGKDVPLKINKHCPYSEMDCLNIECKCAKECKPSFV